MRGNRGGSWLAEAHARHPPFRTAALSPTRSPLALPEGALSDLKDVLAECVGESEVLIELAASRVQWLRWVALCRCSLEPRCDLIG